MKYSKHHYCLKKSEFQSESLPSEDDASELLEEENKKLLCTQCRNHVTSITETISVNGAQSHTFTNPAGVTYNILCYQVAPGCDVVGERTAEYSWFSGYEWQYAICKGCSEHMGWLFSNEHAFFALISNKLVQE